MGKEITKETIDLISISGLFFLMLSAIIILYMVAYYMESYKIKITLKFMLATTLFITVSDFVLADIFKNGDISYIIFFINVVVWFFVCACLYKHSIIYERLVLKERNSFLQRLINLIKDV